MLKCAKTKRAGLKRAYANHAVRVSSLGRARSVALTPRTSDGWRNGLKSLYCRTLARTVSDAFFSYRRSAAARFLGEGSTAAAPTDILPSSWLQLGQPPQHGRVERMRAAIAERFVGVQPPKRPPTVAKASRGASLLDKAA
ncbi:MAG: hypothetical protein NW215_01585 [Hyphomicrobiales bacterium]|nr:hypothetical protein [Hyphomicrobiales bacterium]